MTAVFAGMLTASAFAQPNPVPQGSQPAANRPQPPVRTGVVDMQALLMAHPAFNAQMKELEAKANQNQASVVNMQKILQEELNALNALNQGTPQFEAKHEELIKKRADFQAKVSILEQSQGNEVRKLLFGAYRSIKAEIEEFASPRGFAAILNRATIDDVSAATNEQTAANIEMNQLVVWNAPGMDITNHIIIILNQKYGGQYPLTVKIENGKRIYLERNTSSVAAPGARTNPQPSAAQPSGTPRR